MDVTDRVTAKFHDGGMKLYVDKQPIGEVSYGTSGNEYRFEEGYSQENNKFYQYADVQNKVKRKNIQTAMKKQDGAKQWQLPLFFLFYRDNMA